MVVRCILNFSVILLVLFRRPVLIEIAAEASTGLMQAPTASRNVIQIISSSINWVRHHNVQKNGETFKFFFASFPPESIDPSCLP